MRQSIITFVLMSFVLFSSCCPFKKADKSGAETASLKYDLLVESKDDSGSYTAKTGDKIAVRLESNPSTGYLWEIIENNPEILVFVDKSFESKKRDEKMVGVGGFDTFLFEAKSKGVVSVKLEYHKPFASEGDISKYFQFEITVK